MFDLVRCGDRGRQHHVTQSNNIDGDCVRQCDGHTTRRMQQSHDDGDNVLSDFDFLLLRLI